MSTVPQYSELKRRLNQLSLQKAQYGIDAAPQINTQIFDLQNVLSWIERIDIHRRSLETLLQQRDHFGRNVPSYIVAQIIERRVEITILRKQCNENGYYITAHAVDADQVSTVPASQPQVQNSTNPIHVKLDAIQALLDELRSLV